MNPLSNLVQRGSRWPFQRPFTGSKTLVIHNPLGTIDHARADRHAARLNGVFETMIERFLGNNDELPAALIFAYVDF